MGKGECESKSDNREVMGICRSWYEVYMCLRSEVVKE